MLAELNNPTSIGIADAALPPPGILILRIDEILELGEELRRRAERNGVGVNASHLMVHAVMARAFRDDQPGSVKRSDLQEALCSELRRKLDYGGAMCA